MPFVVAAVVGGVVVAGFVAFIIFVVFVIIGVFVNIVVVAFLSSALGHISVI